MNEKMFIPLFATAMAATVATTGMAVGMIARYIHEKNQRIPSIGMFELLKLTEGTWTLDDLDKFK